MSDPIRILHVLNGLGTGGAEAIVMNWYRHIDRDKVQFDFLIRSNVNIFADEIEKLGGRVYIMPPYPSCYFANKRETTRFFKEHANDYAGIHVHGNALLYVNVFNIAKKYGINMRIFHSHSIQTNFKYLPIHIYNRCRINNLATDFFACSQAAGEWAFKSRPYIVINNGIETDRFVYNEADRIRTRESLGIIDEKVYGHVGRFVPVKNHNFLLEVFEKILRRDDNSLLLLVGEGELLDNVKQLAKEKGISKRIIFTGRRRDIPALMNAMDVFVLPSHYEGLGIVAVEAQASGLPVLLSDNITKDVKMTSCVDFLPLTDSEVWAERCIDLSNISRTNTQEAIINSGYDISSSTKILEEYYCSHN
jgi:glycosyltransferase involved in cell wall biosynthesis